MSNNPSENSTGNDDEDITHWLIRLQGKDIEAVDIIWKNYFVKLANVSENKLRKLPARICDGEDVALSALNTFVQGVKHGRFDFRDRDDAWRLLATIAARKVATERRRAYAQKRGGGKIQTLNPTNHLCAESFQECYEILDENNMPEFKEQVLAQCSDLLNKLTAEELQVTATMKLEGYSNDEISDALNCSLSTTKRRIQKIREIWDSEVA
jgi:DNA-directed RNA polymerase specialized sigma24 family protein